MGSLGERYEEQQASKEAGRRGRRIANLSLTTAGLAAGAAIVLVVALALVVPGLLPKSAAALYEADRFLISEAILVASSGYSPKPPTAHALGGGSADSKKGNYSTQAGAKLGTANALKEEDAGSDEITTLLELESHPGGRADQVGTPSWEDMDGNGIRNPAGDRLFYHRASPAPTVDHWNTTAMDVKGTGYVVDSRDWFIDMDLLVKGGYLNEVPASASPDNSDEGAGSYSWYVNEGFEVKSMLYSRPTVDTGGFREVYP